VVVRRRERELSKVGVQKTLRRTQRLAFECQKSHALCFLAFHAAYSSSADYERGSQKALEVDHGKLLESMKGIRQSSAAEVCEWLVQIERLVQDQDSESDLAHDPQQRSSRALGQ
jgi:hypothetical protein